MATIMTALKIYDGMTPALKSITSAMNTVINGFESLKASSDEPMKVSSIQEARQHLTEASAAINTIEQRIENAGREQDEFTRKTQKTQKAMSALRNIIISVGGAMAFKKGLDLTDTIIRNSAGYKLINDGLQTQAELQQEVYKSAMRSRSAYNDVAATVTKLGILAGESFGSNDEMIAFTELMNKNFTIGRSSAEEQAAAMYQLTQAMASGRLQGDEFRTILESAPLLAQAIAEELEVSTGELKKMAAQGLITSSVIKNAMFNTADEINNTFNELPWTWAQVWITVVNRVQEMFTPLLEAIGRGATWVAENWAVMEPIFIGLATAVALYAVMMGIQTAVTWLSVAANRALAASLLANPLLWIAILIGVVIAVIYKWVQSVGGLKIAWLIVMNAIKTAWDFVAINFIKGVIAVMLFLMKMKLGWLNARNVIVGYVLDMGVKILYGLQNLINGAIGIINDFIALLNKIPGVSIEAVGEVTFATTAAAALEAKKQEMAEDVENQEAMMAAFEEAANQYIADYQSNATAARQAREAEIAEKQAAAEDGGGSIFDNIAGGGGAGIPEDIAGNTGAIADNTGDMADSMELAAEELKYLRELAAQEAINRFTTAEIHIETHNENHIGSDMDIDGVVNQIEEALEEAIATAAEGG